MEEHTILKQVSELKWSVSRLLGKVDVSRLFWCMVHNFCVKYCIVLPCESLGMGTERGPVKRQCQCRGYQTIRRCMQYLIGKTVTLFQSHLLMKYSHKDTISDYIIQTTLVWELLIHLAQINVFSYVGLGFLLWLLLVVFLKVKPVVCFYLNLVMMNK